MNTLLLFILSQVQPTQPEVPIGVRDRIKSIGEDITNLTARLDDLKEVAGITAANHNSRLEIFHGYVPVFIIAFLVTLLSTPIMRRLALINGIIDRPSEARKIHRIPIAYLGGAAVFLGMLSGIFYSYFATITPGLMGFHATQYLDGELPHAVPFSIVLGMTLIMLAGLLDDVVGIPPRLKVGLQLVAAAALAATDVGVKVAAGVVVPVAKAIGLHTIQAGGGETLLFHIPLPLMIGGVNSIPIDMVYWIGTGVIAVFILGACNAANLIDGLDGLLSGTTAIVAGGLLVIALTLALQDDGPRDGPRIVLCLALLGSCLGFLPHNFNPATIFLGDCGSLLLGFVSITIILTFGDTGKTHLVFAGLIIFAIPIIDTVLAIIRRKLSGKRISDADDQHLHHMLKRALGVKGAVFALYGLGAVFAGLGIAISLGRARVVYALVLVFGAFIVVTAVKIARKKQLDQQAHEMASRRPGRLRNPGSTGGSGSPSVPNDEPVEPTSKSR